MGSSMSQTKAGHCMSTSRCQDGQDGHDGDDDSRHVPVEDAGLRHAKLLPGPLHCARDAPVDAFKPETRLGALARRLQPCQVAGTN